MPVREDGELDGVPLHQLVLVHLAAQLYPHVAVARHLLMDTSKQDLTPGGVQHATYERLIQHFNVRSDEDLLMAPFYTCRYW